MRTEKAGSLFVLSRQGGGNESGGQGNRTRHPRKAMEGSSTDNRISKTGPELVLQGRLFAHPPKSEDQWEITGKGGERYNIWGETITTHQGAD